MGLLSVGYLLIAVIDFTVLVWALRLYGQYPSTAQWLATVPLGLMWYDNLVIALGSTIGQGDLLMDLNIPRFLAHYIFLPFGIIAIGAMARQAGFKWAQPRIVFGGFILLALYFMFFDLWLFVKATFYPSCFADILRYTTHISEWTVCSPEDVVGTGQQIMPIPAITFSNMLIIFGVYLWWKIGYKWLFLGSIFATCFFAVPIPLTGGIVGNVGEPIISAVLLMACVHVTRQFGSDMA
ncbi:MAG: hypothetical protein ACR2QG_01500 [Gammaproteobacteria bacterium]